MTSAKTAAGLKVQGTFLEADECLKIDESLVYRVAEADLYELAQFHKRDANELFKRRFLRTAFARYRQAIRFVIIAQQQCQFNLKLAKEERLSLPEDYDTLVERLRLCKVQLLSNLAACQLHSGKYDMVVENCTKCLKIDRNNVKALFRRGQAYESLGEADRAVRDYREAALLAPGDLSIQKKMEFVQCVAKQDEISQKKLAQNLKNMFR